MNIDPLLPFAAPQQALYLRETAACGSCHKAARKLGVSAACVARAIQSVRKKAARAGIAPDQGLTHEVAPGMRLGKVTTQYDADGKLVQEWVRQHPDTAAHYDAIKAAMDDICATHAGRMAPLKPPKKSDKDLLAVYLLPDLHMGMCAWAEEAGEDFDLKIARRQFCATFDALAQSAPPAARTLLLLPGDVIHANTSESATARGTRVDMDTRFARVAQVTIEILLHSIDRLLVQHKQVNVEIIPGNHDEDAAIMLSLAMAAVYSRDMRATVSTDPARFRKTRFGCNLLASCHGHTASTKDLESLMAAEWPKDWGETTHRHWYTGHVHHDSVKEYRGCTVETLRTIAPKDAWNAGKGYRAGRDMKCDIWHKTNGRVARMIQGVVYTGGKSK